MDYSSKVLSEESNTVAVDFDGVIHSHELGFHDGTIYGTPIEGSLEALKTLASKYKIVLYTAKAKADRPLINGKTGIELVWLWLAKYNMDSYITEVTAEKPRAICYVDDKAIRFLNWEQSLKDIALYANESI